MNKRLQLLQKLVRELNVPGLIVAGGAVRDAYLGVPHRDVDLLVEFQYYSLALAAIERVTWHKLAEVSEHDPYEGDFSLYRSHDDSVELIALHKATPLEHVQGFDDDLSMMWVDADGFHADPDALLAAETKVITVYNGNDKRAEKLRKKFPGYTVQLQGVEDIL